MSNVEKDRVDKTPVLSRNPGAQLGNGRVVDSPVPSP